MGEEGSSSTCAAGTEADKGEKEAERGHWSNPCDFFVSCLGYAVGLGNVWRFPFLCYQYGGGSFLVPYLVMLVTAGLPVFFLEIFLGQYAGTGPVKIFETLMPLGKGLGYAMVNVGVLFSFFYIVVVSWALWYLIASFHSPLEWGHCNHEYNSPHCFAALDDSNGTLSKESVAAAEEYWQRHVLDAQGRDWTNYGSPRWQSAATLFLSWSLVAACLIKGVKTSGRVAYVTSLAPYAILLALAARSLTLPGATTGLAHLFGLPQWWRLSSAEMWVAAATQVFFSLGPACGCVITLSSYNERSRNCVRDAVAIAVANSATSIFCGVVVFAILGFMAHDTGKPFDEVVTGGPGLAFIVYPEVVTRMSSPNLWSFLFFAMLIALALGSIFGAFETITSALTDAFPRLRAHKPLLVISISAILFVAGVGFTCGGGIHLFTLFNASAPSWNLLLLALLEIVCVGWLYGAERVIEDLHAMGVHLAPGTAFYWRVCWRYLTPAVLTLLLFSSWLNIGGLSLEVGAKPYPFVIQMLGFAITLSTILWIPAMAAVQLCTSTRPAFGSLLAPTADWGKQNYGACIETEKEKETTAEQ